MGLGVLTLVVALLYIPWLPSNAVVGRWSAVLFGAAILLLRIPIVPGRAHVYGAALLAWMTAGLAWTVTGWDTAGGLVQWVALAAVFCVAYAEPDLRPFWTALAVGVSLSAPFALAQWLGYAPVWSVGPGNPGLFLSSNMAAEAGVLGVIAAGAIRSWPLVIGPAFLAWSSSARAAYVALVAAGVAWVWTARPRDRLAVVAGLLGVAVLAGVAAWTDVRPGTFRISDRLELWSLFVRNTGWLGDGLNSIAVAAPSIEFAHNEVVHYAFELGVGSLALWLVVLHALRGRDPVAVAGIAAILAFALVWFPIHDPLPAFVLAVLAGRLSALRDHDLSLERALRVGSLARARYDDAEEPHRAARPPDGGRAHIPARPQPALGA